MVGVTSIQKKYAPHKLFRIRKRYFVTRENKLRLRYTISTFACISIGLIALFGAGNTSASINDKINKSSLSSAENNYANKQEKLAVLQPIDSLHNFAKNIQNHLTGGIQDLPSTASIIPQSKTKKIKLGKGDTIAGSLQKAGLSGAEAYKAVKAISAHYDPRKVKPGQIIELRLDQASTQNFGISEIQVMLDPIKSVVVSRDENNEFHASLSEKQVTVRSNAKHAKIETSLYGSAERAGIPASIIAELIRIYSWDVDFQRDIREGDKLEVLYETNETEDGALASYGSILYASLSVGGHDIPIYRHVLSNGDADYFEENGRSIRKALMKTPIDGARLSSGFGMRKHPILGYNKMHKGVDFAAPLGTPIYAAGDGIIDMAGRNGGYGNYVRIRHNSSLKTAYAHMHKFAKGISKGKRVKQGQVIGYVGTTGRSTGPHLHYEALQNNKQTNPRKLDMPTGEKLAGAELSKFKSSVQSLKNKYAAMVSGKKYAQRGGGDQKKLIR